MVRELHPLVVRGREQGANVATILTVSSHSSPGRKRSPGLLSILTAAGRDWWPRSPWGVSMCPQQEGAWPRPAAARQGATRCPEGPERFESASSVPD